MSNTATSRILFFLPSKLLFGYGVPLYVFLDGSTETDPRLKGYKEPELFLRVVSGLKLGQTGAV
jgi:hypothetical protein